MVLIDDDYEADRTAAYNDMSGAVMMGRKDRKLRLSQGDILNEDITPGNIPINQYNHKSTYPNQTTMMTIDGRSQSDLDIEMRDNRAYEKHMKKESVDIFENTAGKRTQKQTPRVDMKYDYNSGPRDQREVDPNDLEGNFNINQTPGYPL